MVLSSRVRSRVEWAQSNPRPATGPAATLLGCGAALPERAIDNRYFVDALGLDTSPEWIEQKTGIVNRYYAAEGETTSDLAVRAGRAALESADVRPEELGAVIVATSTPDYTMPATACLVQGRLGATRAAAFDLSNACAGFVYALDIACRYAQTGVERILVIGADRGSRLADPADRTTSVFFGDGAGAVVVGAGGPGRVRASRLFSKGLAEPIRVPVGGTMTMDGPAVWDFATAALPQTLRALCEQADVAIDDIALLAPHQANRNILRKAADEVGLPWDRVLVNLDRVGNTMAASVPLVLDEAWRAGRVRRGDLVALVGFGAGLAWGGMLLEI